VKHHLETVNLNVVDEQMQTEAVTLQQVGNLEEVKDRAEDHPSGTPHKTDVGLEAAPLQRTNWVWSDR
jgi:hypothetical protein